VSSAHALLVEHASVVDPTDYKLAMAFAHQQLDLVRHLSGSPCGDQSRVDSRTPTVNNSE
jgi:hypothetical protein